MTGQEKLPSGKRAKKNKQKKQLTIQIKGVRFI